MVDADDLNSSSDRSCTPSIAASALCCKKTCYVLLYLLVHLLLILVLLGTGVGILTLRDLLLIAISLTGTFTGSFVGVVFSYYIE